MMNLNKTARIISMVFVELLNILWKSYTIYMIDFLFFIIYIHKKYIYMIE